MTKLSRWLLPCVLLIGLGSFARAAQAQNYTVPPLLAQPAQPVQPWPNDRQLVSIGHDSRLPAGEIAQQVVAVFGSSRVDGDATDSAVAVLGDVYVNGTVGDSAVAVMGNVYVNGRVDGDVVAVLGNVTLGPDAVIDGQVTSVLGTVHRNSTAVIQGGTVHVLSGLTGNIEGLHAWVERCLVYGRLLAPTLSIGWAWWLALALLAFYILIAAVFQDGVRRCTQTLQAHPGPSILTAVIVGLLLPVLMMAFVITVVGIAVIPFFWIAMLCIDWFGRVVAIAWVGGSCLRALKRDSTAAPLFEVLIGGLIVLALYMVPFLGFLLYWLLGAFGFGAVVYTLLLAARSARQTPRASGRPLEPQRAAAMSAGAPAAAAAAASMQAEPAAAPTEDPKASAHATDNTGSAAPAPGPTPSPTASPAEALDLASLPRAGFWIRMLALLIDLLLIGFALHLLDHIAGGTLLILATYAAIMWKIKGTTVGGIVCDLKVIRVDGGPMDWGTAIVRALGCFLSLVVAGLGFIWIAVDPEHQAWHDKIAGTVVVRVPKGVGLI